MKPAILVQRHTERLTSNTTTTRIEPPRQQVKIRASISLIRPSSLLFLSSPLLDSAHPKAATQPLDRSMGWPVGRSVSQSVRSSIPIIIIGGETNIIDHIVIVIVDQPERRFLHHLVLYALIVAVVIVVVVVVVVSCFFFFFLPFNRDCRVFPPTLALSFNTTAGGILRSKRQQEHSCTSHHSSTEHTHTYTQYHPTVKDSKQP